MQSFLLLLFLFININLIISNNLSSFDLILNIDGNNNSFRFIEIDENHLIPSVIILDDDEYPTIVNSSSSSTIRTYQTEANRFNIATVKESNLIFAIIQISNGSFYDIIPSISKRSKRSTNDDVDYIVKSNGSIIKQTYVSIEWYNNRQRRAPNKSKILSTTTKRSIINKKNAFPKKSHHINLEIIALVDSLILYDMQLLLNKTEYETIEILKLYYIHIFIGVEQLYRQSLINQTFDINIRLTKIIFATDKYRLPWETYKNISSMINNYRKTHRRPNITLNLLKSLHHSYISKKFDSRFFKNNVDHIMTFTRFDLIDGAGLAFVSGLCLSTYKYSIIQEDFVSFSVILTAAHELGHNLGLNHDETENKCNDPNIKYIMSPKNSKQDLRRQVLYFSPCSIKQLNNFLLNTKTNCWKNSIINIQNETKFEKIRNLISTKLGQIINLHQQCQLQHGLESIPFISITYNKTQTLYEENICQQLRCLKNKNDDFMFWLDGAFDGTPCGENRICYQKKCVLTKEKIKRSNLPICPYGDLFVPNSMLNLKNKVMKGNTLCSDALNLLRERGMNVTYLCYNSMFPYGRLCCEECKKHRIPECGDLHSKCSMFSQYCQMNSVRVDGRPVTELCPYTCGRCPHLQLSSTISEKEKKIQLSKPRKYIKPKKFTEHTCIDMADCSQLIKNYSALKKNVKNWCTEYSTMIKGRYFVEMCPKYCSLCNISSQCDRYKLCRNNGKCIKDEFGTYQCICSSTKPSYGTLCEYQQTCLNNPCLSKKEFCVQTQAENYVCLSKEDKEQIRIILTH